MTTSVWRSVSLLALLLCCVAPDARADTIYVGAGDNLQEALDAAQPGDTILLAQGVEFVGNFVLPVKSGSEWITVRVSTPEAVLPPDGQRIDPRHAPLLARLRSPTIDTAALRTAPGAHHWDIRYLEFAANPMGTGDVIQLGDGSPAQNSLDIVPHHIVLRHVYVHGDPAVGQKRCIALNAAEVTIADSYVADCKSTTQDSQAIGGWNGPGPFTIENNYLEASGENVMFGGSDPAIADLAPSGITFRRNHVSRPMAWRNPIIPAPSGVTAAAEPGGTLAAGTYGYRVVARRLVGNNTMGRSTASAEVTVSIAGDPDNAVHVRWDAVPGATEYYVYGRTPGVETIYWRVSTNEFVDTGAAGSSGAVPTTAGTVWMVKNLFELKNARNVLIEANVFENHWKESQPGWAIVLTPRNSSGGCPWCVVEYVCFQHNLLRNVAAGVNILGYDNARPTKQAHDLRFYHNEFIMTTALGGNGWMMQLGDEPRDVKVSYNTVDSNGNTVLYVYGGTATDPREVWGFEFAGNAARHGTYGINGSFFTYGLGILNAYFPDRIFEANYLAGAPLSRYTPGTVINVVPFEDQFVDTAAGNYTLRPGSPLVGAGPKNPLVCQGCPGVLPHPDIGADHVTLISRAAGTTVAPPDNVPTPPAAAATFTCTYLDCAFADESTAGTYALSRRAWSFGDGTGGTEAAGPHSFPAPGTYTVRLIVWDTADMSDSWLTTVTVRAPNKPPAASFQSTCVDLTCSFQDTSTDSDGTVAAWAWSFGSSGVASEASPTFTFAGPGTYQVTLTVTDNEGATSTATATIDVKALIHVAFGDATITVSRSGKSYWRVNANVSVHGADERPIAGATINATWSGALTRTITCVTGADGLCTFNTGTLSANRTSVTLTVLGVSAPLSVYTPVSNHDAAGNPTGTSATYIKP